MEYLQTIGYNPGSLFLPFIPFGLIILGSIFIPRWSKGKATSTSFQVTVVAAAILCLVSIFALLGFGVSEQQRVGAEHLRQNITKKYDVKEVELRAAGYHAVYYEDEEQNVVVKLADGQRAVFVLTQDKETSEPTLSDMPVNAGAGELKTISVKDITR